MLEKIIFILLVLNYPIIKKIFYISFPTPHDFSEATRPDRNWRRFLDFSLFFKSDYDQRRLANSGIDVFMLLLCLLIGIEMTFGYVVYIIVKFYAENG